MKSPENIEKYGKYYSNDKLSDKLARFARRLGAKLVYYAFVLYYALKSDSLSSKDRKIIIGALGYLILPLDLLPDFIPAIGFTDDAAALTLAIVKVLKNITPEVKAQAKDKLESIMGPVDPYDIEFPQQDQNVDEQ